jgi:membrane protein
LRKSLWHRISNLGIVNSTATYLKRISLPGFKGNSAYEVGSFFVKSMLKEGIKLRSGSLAFSFFLAIFPSILFLFTLVAYIPIKDLDQEILNQLDLLLPDYTFHTLESTLNDILKHQQGGLLSLGALMALYFSSNGMMTLVTAFDKRLPGKNQFFLKKRMKSIGMTFFIAFQVIIGISLIVFADYTVVWIKSHIEVNKVIMMYSVTFLKFIILFLLILASISALYNLGVSVKTRYTLFTPGSILATVLSLTTTYGFSFYVDNFASYNKLYGSIGTVIALMILIYINCMSILIGFELNASIYDAEHEGE